MATVWPDSTANRFLVGYLKRFATQYRPRMLPSGLPEVVSDEEDIARFLTSRGHFNSTMVRPAAFLPNPVDRKKSVCRHGSEPASDLRGLASEYLPPGTKIYGAGICKADHVRAVNLDLIASEPPRRHADIVGWPVHDGDPALQKAAELELAALIASKCGEPVRFSSE